MASEKYKDGKQNQWQNQVSQNLSKRTCTLFFVVGWLGSHLAVLKGPYGVPGIELRSGTYKARYAHSFGSARF